MLIITKYEWSVSEFILFKKTFDQHSKVPKFIIEINHSFPQCPVCLQNVNLSFFFTYVFLMY